MISFKYAGPRNFTVKSWKEAEELVLGFLEEDYKELSDEDLKEAAKNAEADRKVDEWKEREIA